MGKVSYIGNAIIVTAEAGAAGQGSRHRPIATTVTKMWDPAKPREAAAGFIALTLRVAEGLTWNVRLFPQLGGETIPSCVSESFRKWYARLNSLVRLQQGWDSHGSPPPLPGSLSAARRYLDMLQLLRWEPTRLEASVMGGVGVTHRGARRKVYVEFYNNGMVHALFSDRPLKMETVPVGTDVQSYFRFIAKARGYLNG